jgi:hypothetical protein
VGGTWYRQLMDAVARAISSLVRCSFCLRFGLAIRGNELKLGPPACGSQKSRHRARGWGATLFCVGQRCSRAFRASILDIRTMREPHCTLSPDGACKEKFLNVAASERSHALACGDSVLVMEGFANEAECTTLQTLAIKAAQGLAMDRGCARMPITEHLDSATPLCETCSSAP